MSTPFRSARPTLRESGTTFNFSYTGSYQNFSVPEGVTSITVYAFGAQGGTGNYPGGFGGYIETSVSVTPNTALFIYVGGAGNGVYGGYNGGGNGGYYDGYSGGGEGGGGATADIRTIFDDPYSRIVVVGGGGGGSYDSVGGGGGGLVGESGLSIFGHPDSYGGYGGSQDSGGAGGFFSASYGYGGSGGYGLGGDAATNSYGGGGGSGYYGGGGGAWLGGGGGSSLSIGSIGVNAQGNGSGHGFLQISIPNVPSATPSFTPSLVSTTFSSASPSATLTPIPSNIPSAWPTAASSRISSMEPTKIFSAVPVHSPPTFKPKHKTKKPVNKAPTSFPVARHSTLKPVTKPHPRPSGGAKDSFMLDMYLKMANTGYGHQNIKVQQSVGASD
eukprot:gene6363-biopygen6725